jgi:hypothetical protein
MVVWSVDLLGVICGILFLRWNSFLVKVLDSS